VDVQARQAFTATVIAFDQAGHQIWQRLLSTPPSPSIPEETPHAHHQQRHTTH
jgi:hypothetical protein